MNFNTDIMTDFFFQGFDPKSQNIQCTFKISIV